VALGDATRGVPKQGGDGQFGEAQVAGEAREGVPEHMGRNRLQLRGRGQALGTRAMPTKRSARLG
jgi:hypothetical protein